MHLFRGFGGSWFPYVVVSLLSCNPTTMYPGSHFFVNLDALPGLTDGRYRYTLSPISKVFSFALRTYQNWTVWKEPLGNQVHRDLHRPPSQGPSAHQVHGTDLARRVCWSLVPPVEQADSHFWLHPLNRNTHSRGPAEVVQTVCAPIPGPLPGERSGPIFPRS